jgi:hypothetical protein
VGASRLGGKCLGMVRRLVRCEVLGLDPSNRSAGCAADFASSHPWQCLGMFPRVLPAGVPVASGPRESAATSSASAWPRSRNESVTELRPGGWALISSCGIGRAAGTPGSCRPPRSAGTWPFSVIFSPSGRPYKGQGVTGPSFQRHQVREQVMQLSDG